MFVDEIAGFVFQREFEARVSEFKANISFQSANFRLAFGFWYHLRVVMTRFKCDLRGSRNLEIAYPNWSLEPEYSIKGFGSHDGHKFKVLRSAQHQFARANVANSSEALNCARRRRNFAFN